jgi:antitoxin component of MazEF toxin-antitoxin module
MSSRGAKRSAAEHEEEGVFHFSVESELSSRYQSILFSEQFSDVTLVVGPDSVSIPAHRLVLGLASPFFRVLTLEGEGWHEKSASEVRLPHDTPAIVKLCLEWMYTAAVSVTAANSLLVLEAARRYELQELQRGCRNAAMHFASKSGPSELPPNLLSVFTSAIDMGDHPLKELVLPLLGKHAMAVLSTDELRRTSRAEHLCELIAYDGLAISELHLYKSILEWCDFSPSNRKPSLPKVLQHLRLVLLKRSELHTTIRESGHFPAERILDALAQKDVAASSRRWRLVPNLPSFQTEELGPSSRIVFGRSPESSTVQVLCRKISKTHCSVAVEGNHVVVTDHGSSNGTWIGDKRLAPHVFTRLRSGVTLRFSVFSGPFRGRSRNIVPTYTLQRVPIANPLWRPRAHPPDDNNYSVYSSDDDSDSDDSDALATRAAKRLRQQRLAALAGRFPADESFEDDDWHDDVEDEDDLV